MLTCQCKRTKAITQEPHTETRTRNKDSEDSTMACKMILNNLDVLTMGASMLIRTLQVPMVSSIRTSVCPRRAECMEMHMVQEVVSTATLSKTSTEETLHLGQLTWSTHRQRTREAQATSTKCLLLPRTRSTDQATSSRTESPGSLLTRMTSLLRLDLNLPTRRSRKATRRPRNRRNKTKCW